MQVRIWSRAYPGGLGRFDGDWLNAELVVRTRVRSWRYFAFLRAEDFAGFAADLGALRAGAADHAIFEPHDPWLRIEVRSRSEPGYDVEPGYDIDVSVREAGTEKCARFQYHAPLTELARLARETAALSAAFPPRSSSWNRGAQRA